MKINIKSDGMSTRVTDENGDAIAGVTKIVIEPDAPLTAQLVLDGFSADMAGKFVMQDPRDGKIRTVKKIEFDDADPFQPGSVMFPTVLRMDRRFTEKEVEEIKLAWNEKYRLSPGPISRLWNYLK